MDGSSSLWLIFIGLFILSAIYSSSEMAISSASRIRYKTKAESGDKKAKEILDVIENPSIIIEVSLILHQPKKIWRREVGFIKAYDVDFSQWSAFPFFCIFYFFNLSVHSINVISNVSFAQPIFFVRTQCGFYLKNVSSVIF